MRGSRAAALAVLVLAACASPGALVRTAPPVPTDAPRTSSELPTARPASTGSTAPSGEADGSVPREADAAAAWTDLRRRLPAELAVIRPTYLPPELGPTVSYTFFRAPEGWNYGVGYRSGSGTTITFILGPVNSGFPDRQEQITVRGQSGLLLISSQSPRLQVTWLEGDRRYYIQANGISTDDLRRIAAGLTDER